MKFPDILKDNLQTFAKAVDIQTSLLDTEGNILTTYGEEQPYCGLFRQATGKYCPCAQMHAHSCQLSVKMGEEYIFSCPAGLIHFCVPIIRNAAHVASVLAGPISLSYPDISLVDEVMQKHNIKLDYRNRMFTSLAAVPLIEPRRARYLSKLLFQLMTNLALNESAQMEERARKTSQQAKIGEYIQVIKENPDISHSHYSMEQKLISEVLSGNVSGANAILNEMLGRIYFSSGNNIEIIKTRMIELVAILARAVNEDHSDREQVYEMTERFLRDVNRTGDLTDLSYTVLEMLERFSEIAFSNTTQSKLPVIKKSVQYISGHYNQNPTLENVARHVGLNPAYFSSLFKKETGMNFTGFIMKVKLEHAQRLLRNSSLPLATIAVELGFESQSYFSSSFKKHVGMTPKAYRQSL